MVFSALPRKRWILLAVYGLILCASHLYSAFRPATVKPLPDSRYAKVVDPATNQPVTVAFREFGDSPDPARPTIILIHGSPGRRTNFAKVAPKLAEKYRVIVPDLPGFGDSTLTVSDYSVRAHAKYVVELMDALHIRRAHLVGYSMGGGVVLNVADLAPERVASISMFSAIGAQEMEMFGDYTFNHLIHGVQLSFIWLIKQVIPHFGLLDGEMNGMYYARNFFDTDQRPLRDILGRYAGPMFIFHGTKDFLVPVEAAREHARLVPQSEVHILENEDHFTVFTNPDLVTKELDRFVTDVEAGKVAVRATATADRVADSKKPFDAANLPKPIGITAAIFFCLIALGTFFSEDITCITVGTLAAQGRVGFAFVVAACILGIFVSDVLIFLTGRYLGRAAVTRAPFKWLIKPDALEKGTRWFHRRGMVVIILSRCIPGMRVPTYFTAGIVHVSPPKFCLFLISGALMWTPFLIFCSGKFGAAVMQSAVMKGNDLFPKLVVAGIVGFVVVRLGMTLSTANGRHHLRARLKRWKKRLFPGQTR